MELFRDYRDYYGYGHDPNISLSEYEYRKQRYTEQQNKLLSPLLRNYAERTRNSNIDTTEIVRCWTTDILRQWSIFDNMTMCTNSNGRLPETITYRGCLAERNPPMQASMNYEKFTLRMTRAEIEYSGHDNMELVSIMLRNMGDSIMFDISEKYAILDDQGYEVFPYIVLEYIEQGSRHDPHLNVTNMEFRHYYGVLRKGQYKRESARDPFPFARF